MTAQKDHPVESRSMIIKKNISLKPLTTFQVEAAARDYVRFDEDGEIIDFLRGDRLKGLRHLVLGGGSNLLFVDDFDGVVLHPAMKGISVAARGPDHVRVRAMAGESWDDLVAFAVAHGWGGIENLSRIPGNVGASVVQNIGAYGVEVGDFVDTVEAVSLMDGRRVVFSGASCGLGYRHSRFKDDGAGRFIITAVVFRLTRQPEYVVRYPGVKTAVDRIGALTLANLRRAVIGIRESKLPDPAVVPNAGSFFKNPVVSGERVAGLRRAFPDLPYYPAGDDRFKLPAGWLIERCGWKGRSLGNAAVHRDHALVLVNPGGATGREIYDLSERIRQSVLDRFGVALHREVVVVP
ncbi:UDP-N-acetylmuramate dehydrogenase [Desulfococcus sp.]|uniref:UDP-N-acetylmuramate dehydrogenase n=1 Tax=Desulfococcus sp. TaxID=2025834 RepID=UPI003592FBC7